MIISSLIKGKDKSNFSFFKISIESKDVFPQTPQDELVKKFLLSLSISKFSILFIHELQI